ncbi:hypothetical protein ACP26L_18455 [Paenibacillus sp. S-38]|uniref:hypothetical protein n=1 Tax=Paenibacillus sp. S-38 TaxID=3416710 RepID=UPI003CFA6FF7
METEFELDFSQEKEPQPVNIVGVLYNPFIGPILYSSKRKKHHSHCRKTVFLLEG